MARCMSVDRHIKNGLRYKVVSILTNDKTFELVAIDDDGAATGESFVMSETDLSLNMRLTHAITYFSSQARTIKGSLRLEQTSAKLFTIRHLIVGLGRAPNGRDIQVGA